MGKPRKSTKRNQAPQAEHRVFPMEVQIGDRLVNETGEWEVVAPFTAAAGKNARMSRFRKVGQRQFTDLKSWGAQERISVRRAPGERG